MANTLVETLTVTLDTDNAVDPGQKVVFGGVIVTTSTSNEWVLVVDYNDYISTSGTGDVAAEGEVLLEAFRSLDTSTGYSVTVSPSITPETILSEPTTNAVYRWAAEEHTTISPVVGTSNFFSAVPGSQGVLVNTN